MTTVLITGGAGFIGSHLVEYLLSLGQEVYIIDDLSTGSIGNISHLKSHPRFHYTIDSVMHEPVLAELIDTCEKKYEIITSKPPEKRANKTTNWTNRWSNKEY